jgi:hypothetical protein
MKDMKQKNRNIGKIVIGYFSCISCSSCLNFRAFIPIL